MGAGDSDCRADGDCGFVNPCGVLNVVFIQSQLFVVPMSAITLFIIAGAIQKTYALYIKKDHVIPNLRKGQLTLVTLGGCHLFLGVFGYFFTLFKERTFSVFLMERLLFILCRGGENENMVMSQFVQWILGNIGIILLSLMLTFFTARIRFFLSRRFSALNRQRLPVCF